MADRGSFDEFYAGAVSRLVGQLFPVTATCMRPKRSCKRRSRGQQPAGRGCAPMSVPEASVRSGGHESRHRPRPHPTPPYQSNAQAPSATRGPAGLGRALALAQAVRTLRSRSARCWCWIIWSTCRWRRSPTRSACPTAPSRASLSRAAARWRPSSARPRRCRPLMSDLRTTPRARRYRRPPRPTPGPEVARRRAHLRRLRLLGGAAMLVVLAMVAGTVATTRYPNHPTSKAPT